MYARSTTVLSDPQSLDAGIAFIRDEVMPAIAAMDGYVGLSMLVDRADGKSIVTSSWQTAEAMAASAPAVDLLRDKASEVLGGAMTVADWEIAVVHRAHLTGDGTCARCTWTQSPLDVLDEGIDVIRQTTAMALEGIDGFCSMSLFVNRDTGLCVATTSWDTRAAMEASRDAAGSLREQAAAGGGQQILDVAEFELVMAHLRVPELV